jgi:hypothetical protein
VTRFARARAKKFCERSEKILRARILAIVPREQEILISPIFFQSQCIRDRNAIVHKSFCARA